MEQGFRVFPIGVIRREGESTWLEIREIFLDGLLGLDQFSHVWLFCWFHQSDTEQKRATLQVHPRNDKRNPLTGVFATRSPRRPNPVAIYLSAIHSMHGNKIELDPLDAMDGTPVVDIKPYIPLSDSISDAVIPEWVKRERT